MSFTEKEAEVFQDVLEWEKQLFQYEATDFELTFDKYFEQSFSILPEEVKEEVFSTLDNWLFHLHAIIQGSQLQMDAKERILAAGRVFQPEIATINDLQKLTIDQRRYIAEQQISRHQLYSLVQGGLSGTGKSLLLGSDIPAMVVINLRVVQLIANVYGYEVNTPYEMMNALKVFHAAILPTRIQKQAWEELFADFDAKTEYFYEGNERVTDLATMEQPVKQIFKAMVILLFRRKAIKGIPIISIGIGAGSNYLLTKKVTDFAHKYYQMRYLLTKKQS